MVLDLVLEQHIEIRGLTQANSQVSWNDYIHNIDPLDENAEWVEPLIQLLYHRRGQLRFHIPDSAYFDGSNEISNRFFALSFQKFLQLVRAQIVQEF